MKIIYFVYLNKKIMKKKRAEAEVDGREIERMTMRATCICQT
jgi:hypothetical protein